MLVIDEVDMDSGLATPEVCVYIYVTGCMQVCVVYVYLNAEGRCQIKEFDRFKVARGRKRIQCIRNDFQFSARACKYVIWQVAAPRFNSTQIIL
jgi:hypothetical protein